METPPVGADAACPSCGQRFEGFSAAPPYGAGGEGRSFRGDREGDEQYFRRGPMPHSGLGVASFLIGVIVLVIDLVLLVLLVVVASGPRGLRSDAASTVGGVFGIFNCVGVLAALGGLGVGVGGIFQENRNRTFAVIGVVLNGLIVVAVTLLFLIGMAVL
jgi:hypothetical protein